jgi:hypothetical protein
MDIKYSLFLIGLSFTLFMVFHGLNVGIAYAADTTYYISLNQIIPEGGYGETFVLCPEV